MTILIADDHDTNRKLAAVVLRFQGYEVVEARNGQEALDWLNRITEPTVALIDWDMPGIDGITVCRNIRQKPHLPPLFIILLTVKDTEEEKVIGLEAGANDYITKPFDHPEFIERVKSGVQKILART